MPEIAIPTIHIRPARQQDIGEMILLLKSLFAIEEDFIFDPERHRLGLNLLLDNPASLVLVAEVDRQLVGMCSGQTVISTAEGGPALLVEDVVVATPLQGRGIATRMLQRLAEWAKTRRISRMQLLADRNNNKALKFYVHRGWQTTQLICLRHYLDTLHGSDERER
jgi:GNAT superfamily N-acetyltransferase